MKQNVNGQKGFTAAAMVLSVMFGAAVSTYFIDQVAHNHAGVVTKIINAEKYSRANLYNMSQDRHAGEFKAMVAKCQTTAGIASLGEGGLVACKNVHYVNTQLLGNYS